MLLGFAFFLGNLFFVSFGRGKSTALYVYLSKCSAYTNKYIDIMYIYLHNERTYNVYTHMTHMYVCMYI